MQHKFPGGHTYFFKASSNELTVASMFTKLIFKMLPKEQFLIRSFT